MSVQSQFKKLRLVAGAQGLEAAEFKIYPGYEVVLRVKFEGYDHRAEIVTSQVRATGLRMRLLRTNQPEFVADHRFLEVNLHLILKHLKAGDYKSAVEVAKTQSVVIEEVAEGSQ